MKRVANSAYPRVISNLGTLSDSSDTRTAINMIRFMNHYARNLVERRNIIEFFKENKYVGPAKYVPDGGGGGEMEDMPEQTQAFKNQNEKGIDTRRWMHMMNDYFAVGYANTLGFAHANTGDTMTAVMIGGLRTVMNGDFEVFPGDLVQFYWWARQPCFCFACPPSLTFFPAQVLRKGRFPAGRAPQAVHPDLGRGHAAQRRPERHAGAGRSVPRARHQAVRGRPGGLGAAGGRAHPAGALRAVVRAEAGQDEDRREDQALLPRRGEPAAHGLVSRVRDRHRQRAAQRDVRHQDLQAKHVTTLYFYRKQASTSCLAMPNMR